MTVTVWEGNNKLRSYEINPLICEECKKVTDHDKRERLLNYENGKIWIHHESSKLTSIYRVKIRSFFSFPPPFPQWRRQYVCIYLPNPPPFLPTAKNTYLIASSYDTIENIKLKITQRFNLPPIQQQLVFNGVVLENSKTLYECGIMAKYLLSPLPSLVNY